jgi:16S rRNA (guanine527-N7)-methyltransferase
MPNPLQEFTESLSQQEAAFGLDLQPNQIELLAKYYELLRKWNPRLHLVAPCSPADFAVRHVLESLLLLKHLPQNASIIDVGSGGGLPIMPCLAVRHDLSATIVESSQKKGVFLNEALRAVAARERSRLVVSRFEETESLSADFITARALENFSEILPALIEWAPPHATFLLFAGETLRDRIRSLLRSVEVERIPQSERRFLVIGHR